MEFRPRIDSLDSLSEGEAQARLGGFRKEQAREAEKQAVLAEVHAAQFRAVQDRLPSRQGGIEEATARDRAAREARMRADALHQRADTDPEEFADAVLEELRRQLASAEAEYLVRRERAEAPEAYAGNGESPESLVEAAVVLEEGVLATRAKITELEAEEQD